MRLGLTAIRSVARDEARLSTPGRPGRPRHFQEPFQWPPSSRLRLQQPGRPALLSAASPQCHADFRNSLCRSIICGRPRQRFHTAWLPSRSASSVSLNAVLVLRVKLLAFVGEPVFHAQHYAQLDAFATASSSVVAVPLPAASYVLYAYSPSTSPALAHGSLSLRLRRSSEPQPDERRAHPALDTSSMPPPAPLSERHPDHGAEIDTRVELSIDLGLDTQPLPPACLESRDRSASSVSLKAS